MTRMTPKQKRAAIERKLKKDITSSLRSSGVKRPAAYARAIVGASEMILHDAYCLMHISEWD